MGNSGKVSVEFKEVDGIKAGKHRSVYFLRLDEKELNGEEKFNGIKRNVDKKKIKRAMDYWINNISTNSLHHGWDKRQHNGEFVQLHVFKGNQQRLYGYKYRPGNNRQTEVCVIVEHIVKSQNQSDVALLKKTRDTAERKYVQDALKKRFG